MRLAPVRPMLASAGPVPEGSGWAYEPKWDGMRAVVVLDDAPRAMTRNDRDVIAGYPELERLRPALGRDLVLDGEVVALGPDGRPSFGLLQRRMHVTRPAQVAALATEVPVGYVVFDLLADGAESLLGMPWERRRERLEDLDLAAAGASVSPAFPGPGADVLAAARAGGLEGVVAKRRDAAYEPGRRSAAWVKTKLERMQEVVVVGWEPGAGRRQGLPGALLLAVPDDTGVLRYAGQVGTGFTDRSLADLARLLATREQPDAAVGEVPRPNARAAHWVRPDLVGEVTFSEWTADGRLRHPSWRGLRPDKDASEVRREP